MDRFFAYSRLLSTGAPVGGATITVYSAGTFDLATVYDDAAGANAKANPFLADSNGYFFFYAAAGKYDVRISEGGPVPIPVPYTWGDVSIGTAEGGLHVLATASGLGPLHTVSGLTVGHVLTATSATSAKFQSLPAGGGGSDHGGLTGLLDDDHVQYAILTGRGDTQVLRGGTTSGGSLELDATLNATKGPIILQRLGGNVGIGTASPASTLEVAGVVSSTVGGFKFPDGTTQLTSATAASEWANNGDDIYAANVGDVGIGITTPSRKLHVVGGVVDSIQVRVQSAAGFSAGVEFYEDSTVHGGIFASVATFDFLAGGTSSGIRVSNSTGWTHVGSTTAPNASTPAAPLHVTSVSTAVNEQVRVESRTGFNVGIGFFEGASQIASLRGNSTAFGIKTYLAGVESGSLQIRASDGYVGINTALPQSPIHFISSPGATGGNFRMEDPSSAGPFIEFYNNATRLGAIGASTGFQGVALQNGGSNGFLILRNGSGYVGITPSVTGSATNPARPLEVESVESVPIQLRLRAQGVGSTGIEFVNNQTTSARVQATATHLFLYSQTGQASESINIQHSNGYVGVGLSTPTERLDVSGNVHAAAFNTSSDQRFKHDVQSLAPTLPRVRALRGVSYLWNDFYRETLGRGDHFERRHIGLIAQEVLPYFPELVQEWHGESKPEAGDPAGATFYGLNYDRFVAVLIEAIKELADEVDKLKEAT